jgi:hypothetical protein
MQYQGAMAGADRAYSLVHGMWGNPKHLAELLRIVSETKGTAPADDPSAARLEVLVAETNSTPSYTISSFKES